MKVHANAALGPAGRLALVNAIESGMSQKAAAACRLLRRASDGSPLVAPAPSCNQAAARVGQLAARSIKQAAPLSSPALRPRPKAHL